MNLRYTKAARVLFVLSILAHVSLALRSGEVWQHILPALVVWFAWMMLELTWHVIALAEKMKAESFAARLKVVEETLEEAQKLLKPKKEEP